MKRLWSASVFLVLGLLACTSRFSSIPVSNASLLSDDSLSLHIFWPKSDTSYPPIQFTTKVWIYGKEVEGILLLKKKSTQLYRATFLAKGAYKLFDMELMPDTFQIVDHAKQLSNPVALRTLANDMQILTYRLHQTFIPEKVNSDDHFWLMQKAEHYHFYFKMENDKLVQVLQTDSKDTKNTQLILSDYQGSKPTKLQLQHLRFHMKIELTLHEN